MAYLQLMDDMLADAGRRLAETFRLRQADYVLGLQRDDGGFPGRHGPSDIYYTRFALQTLAVAYLDAGSAPWRRAADWVGGEAVRLGGLADGLSLLHSIQILESRGAPPLCCDARRQEVFGRVRSLVEACRTDDGGFAATPGGSPGPYHAFLAALCFDVLDETLPDEDTAVRSVLSCRGADGGFAEAPGRAASQTNPTAATVGLLQMTGRLDDATAADAAQFLRSMQAQDGGLRVHGSAADSDLLSTFTGLLTLNSLDELRGLRLGGVGRFVRGLAMPSGGFRATAGDAAADVEYAFYGLAALAVLAGAVGD